MSEQNNSQIPSLQRPSIDDPELWKGYWEMQNQTWRTEPEIDAERQKYLSDRISIKPNIEKGIYPLKNIKLSRADVEWLLATHENGRGPVHWYDESQRGRRGIDMRGADLRGVDLSNLPLARILGGLTIFQRSKTNEEQREMAAVLMEETNLFRTHLEGSILHHAHLENANLDGAYLANAQLRWSYLERANLTFAHLQGVHLRGAHLNGANLRDTNLADARFEDAVLIDVNSVGPQVADAQWDGINLAVMKWAQVKMLGDEYVAKQMKDNASVKRSLHKREFKENNSWVLQYEIAVRAYRQLAIGLQSQGLNEEATRFAYRAQKLQRVVLRSRKKFGQYIFSGFLDLLAGYGYHPLRTLFWYAFTICIFAFAYHYVWVTYHLDHVTKNPLSYVGAVVFSITAFHGRGFFLGGDFGYDSLITILAAIEAVIGLIIEFSFIATFTQRFFGR